MERLTAAGNLFTVQPIGPKAELAVQVCGQDWNDAQWKLYCEMIVVYVERHGAPRALFNFSPYQGPSARQRQMLVDEYGDRIHMTKIERTALVTDSRVVRGIMTALSWLQPTAITVKAFGLRDHQRAFAWLAEVAAFEPDAAQATFRELLAFAGYDEQILA